MPGGLGSGGQVKVPFGTGEPAADAGKEAG